MSSKINITGYSFPGSSKDVMKRFSLQNTGSPSSHLMKYDLNVQPYADQPGAQFKKDPGGMAGLRLVPSQESISGFI
jgi:hypothetical protein